MYLLENISYRYRYIFHGITIYFVYFSWPEFSKGFLSNLVYSTFEVGAFVTQFLQVWNTEHSAFNLEALPTPSPPKVSQFMNPLF